MTFHEFAPRFHVAGRFHGYAPTKALLAEQGMFAAPEPFARRHGGPLTQRVLDAIPDEYRHTAHQAGLELNIDVRVHDLDEGDYPASPGWHCDSPFREVAFDDRATTQAVQRNLIATISDNFAGVSNTEFLTHTYGLHSNDRAGSHALWRNMNGHLNELARTRPLNTVSATDGELIEFDCTTLHRATPAHRDGVRLFCRISMWTPPHGHQPGLTTCEQVYRLVDQVTLRKVDRHTRNGERR